MGSTRRRHSTDTGDWQRRRILQFVQEFGRREGYSPSYREIGENLGLAVSSVSYHVGILEQEGLLCRGAGQPRTITEPTGPATRAEGDKVEVPLTGGWPVPGPCSCSRSRGLDDRGGHHRR